MGEFSHIIDDMTWSFSRLDSFEQCPYEWVSSYIYDEPERGIFFTQFGSCIHLVSAQYLSGEIEKDMLRSKYVSEFSEMCDGYFPSRKIKSDRFQEGLSYFSSPLSTLFDLDKRKILGVEERFEITLGDVPFNGVIDLISEDGGLVITDHKSSNIRPPSGRKKPTQYDIEREQKTRQLYVYAQAIKEKYGQYPDRLEFNCYRVPQIISIPFNQKDMDATVLWANDRAREISACDYFRPNVDFFYCKFLCDLESCPYRELL